MVVFGGDNLITSYSKLNNNCTISEYIQIYFINIEEDIHLLIVKVFGLDIGSGEIAHHRLDSHYVSLKFL